MGTVWDMKVYYWEHLRWYYIEVTLHWVYPTLRLPYREVLGTLPKSIQVTPQLKWVSSSSVPATMLYVISYCWFGNYLLIHCWLVKEYLKINRYLSANIYWCLLIPSFEHYWLIHHYLCDSRFMKPLLTNCRPTLLETMPKCCLPFAKLFTTEEQISQVWMSSFF